MAPRYYPYVAEISVMHRKGHQLSRNGAVDAGQGSGFGVGQIDALP